MRPERILFNIDKARCRKFSLQVFGPEKEGVLVVFVVLAAAHDALQKIQLTIGPPLFF